MNVAGVVVLVVLVAVAFVDVVDVSRLIAVVFVSIALVNIVLLHCHRLCLLASLLIYSRIRPIRGYSFPYINITSLLIHCKKGACASAGLCVRAIRMPASPSTGLTTRILLYRPHGAMETVMAVHPNPQSE